MCEGRVQSEVIAICAEPRDLADAHRGEVAVRAERLARVDVRHVHLDGRNLDRLDRVAQADRRVRVASSVAAMSFAFDANCDT